MSHNFDAISLRNESHPVEIDKFPDECPCCHSKIFGNHLLSKFTNNQVEGRVQLIFQCTNHDCENVFIGYYEHNSAIQQQGSRKKYKLKKTKPVSYTSEKFSESIENISSNFTQIYNQSKIAEVQNLTQITGLGYRKSLEFLIKDYSIYKNPTKEESIKKINISNCISTYIDDSNIKECAKRAVWLGNDEAHYIRKWEDKDIDDLKLLIKLTVNWIENNLLTEKYISEMKE